MSGPLGLLFWIACSGAPDTGKAQDDTGVIGHDTGTEVVDDTAAIGDDTGGHETADTGWGDDDTLYTTFFDPTVVQRVDLTLSEDSLAALRLDPGTYVEGAFEHDGHRLDQVGIKLTGGGSTGEDLDGKPSFKLKLDEYDEHGAYGGLTHLLFDNMEADPAQVREVLSSAVWIAAGMPAARVNYAEVYVNDDLFGLYANVEPIDDAFLARRYADPSGDLWEAQSDADFTPTGTDNFDLASGDGDTVALDAARRAIQGGGGSFYDAADTVLDMSQFLDFWAWQVAIGNDDGYPYDLDDFYLYANPDVGGRYQFVPWGMDETWDSGQTWNGVDGTVAAHCVYDDACVATFKEHVTAALSTYEGLDVPGLLQSASDLSLQAVTDDTRREAALSDVSSARTALATVVLNRPTRVRSAMGL